jgi:hypothetical protein
MLKEKIHRLEKIAYYLLGISMLFASYLLIFKPIPDGQNYGTVFKCVGFLILLILLKYFYSKLINNRIFLLLVFITGSIVAVANIKAINNDAEIIKVYESVFKIMEEGKNPYVVKEIYHRDANDNGVYGTFNYPPLEIFPFFFAYKLTGTWNSIVLTTTMIFMHCIAFVILLMSFPKIYYKKIIAFFPFLVFLNVFTNVFLTFILVALIIKEMVNNDLLNIGNKKHRLYMCVLFGLGLNVKFFIIPLMGAYYWNMIDYNNFKKTFFPIVFDIGVIIIVACLIMMPFGIWNVIKSTLLFNLILEDRAELTTYFPNVLSGIFYLTNTKIFYPFIAVLMLGTSILLTPFLKPFNALIVVCYTFLLVIPTPELQYIPVMLHIILAAIFTEELLLNKGKVNLNEERWVSS